MKRYWITAIVLLAAIASIAQSSGEAQAAKRTVAICWAMDDTERSKSEIAALCKYFTDAGYNTSSASANYDARLQEKQIRDFVDNGASLIVVYAEDKEYCVAAIEYADSKGVKTIAYDRSIPTASLSLYISYDWREIGREQARGMLALIDRGRYVLLCGSPADPAASVFREGQIEILKPFIDSGAIEIVASLWAENWATEIAQTKVSGLIERLGPDGFDAVLASNDSTALGAVAALRDAGLSGKYPLSGQDAWPDALEAIRRGEMSFTIFKDIGQMPRRTFEASLDLLNGIEPLDSELRDMRSFLGPGASNVEVKCVFMPLVRLDAGNMDEVMSSGQNNY